MGCLLLLGKEIGRALYRQTPCVWEGTTLAIAVTLCLFGREKKVSYFIPFQRGKKHARTQ